LTYWPIAIQISSPNFIAGVREDGGLFPFHIDGDQGVQAYEGSQGGSKPRSGKVVELVKKSLQQVINLTPDSSRSWPALNKHDQP